MINYTQDMIDKVSTIKGAYLPSDEVTFWYLKNKDIIDYSLNIFKRGLAEYRKSTLDNDDEYKEDQNDITLKYLFYQAVDTLKETGVGALYVTAYSGAIKDPTGKTAIDFLSKVHIKSQPTKIEAKIENDVSIFDLIKKGKVNITIEDDTDL